VSGAPVLLLRSSAGCTGLERRIVLIAGAAAAAGLQPHIAVFYRRRAGLPATHPLVTLARAAGSSASQIDDPAPASPAAPRALAGLLAVLRPALIHTADYRSDALALLACRLAGVRPALAATCHGHTGATPALRLYEALDRRLLRQFDGVAGVSAYGCRTLRAWGVPAERVTHLPNPLEPGWAEGLEPGAPAQFRRAWGIAGDERLVGFFGRPTPDKGLDLLLAAARGLGARLLVAGPPPPPALRRLAPAGTVFAGPLADVRPAMLACDVVAVPSRREAFGLAALEALGLSRPVVATDAGGLPELIRPGDTGWVVPAGDPTALADGLAAALSDPPAAAEMGRRGRADVEARFAACEILPRVVAFYSHLLDLGRNRA